MRKLSLVQWQLTEIHNGYDGRAYPLGSTPLTIGRSPACNIVVEGRYISRRHAEIQRQADGCVLTVHSANGVLLDGILANGHAALVLGAVIALPGRPDITWRVSDADATDTFGPGAGLLVIDAARHEAILGGHALVLRPKEFEALALLHRAGLAAVPKQDLVRALWPESADVPHDADLNTLITGLRRKLEAATPAGRRVAIVTASRYGYRLDMA